MGDVRMNHEETLITTAVDEWFLHNTRHTEHTQKMYKRQITRFLDSLPAEVKTIDKLHPAYVEKFIDSLLDKMQNSTVNRHLVAIKGFCSWLSRNYGVPNYAKEIRRLREEPAITRLLSKNEYKRILDFCSEQQAACLECKVASLKHKAQKDAKRFERYGDVVKFLSHTGLRVSEFVSLKWRNVSADNTMLTVIGKCHKKRSVPVNSICQKIISKYERGKDDENLPIAHYHNRKSLYNACVYLSEQVGIPSFGPHILRHYFAVSLLKKGLSLGHIQRLLGHSSIKTTEIYLRLSDDDLKGCTEILCEE